ncbi:type IX secretion system membrane protein PorP/SprF [Flavobacterium sp. LAR06]|uniref:PorP/SprF family type IX secretion system membrane protein n=1 Tax=Flavobacterium sp. LAR06 TaxID=3064897 RepID=UPI0035C0A2D7
MKKKILVILLLIMSSANAQQDPQYTQYMYNTINVNPAYAGSRGVASIFGMHRTQWVGLDGAPVTNTLSVNSPVGKNVGLGVSFVNDRIGVMDENTLSVDFSYTIKGAGVHKFAFGLKGSADVLNVDYTKLDIYNPADPSYQANIENHFMPNFGVGVYWYSDTSYIGLSVPNLLESDHYDDNTVAVAKEKRHYYLIGGYVFDLSYNLKFKPAVMIKAAFGAPLQVDISGNFLFAEKFTVGLAYRWDASVSGMAGFQITKGIFAGYAYDMETTKLANYNSGSHEIFLRFELFGRQKNVMDPRFF